MTPEQEYAIRDGTIQCKHCGRWFLDVNRHLAISMSCPGAKRFGQRLDKSPPLLMMNIHVTKTVFDRIAAMVARGDYLNKSELVRTAIMQLLSRDE